MRQLLRRKAGLAESPASGCNRIAIRSAFSAERSDSLDHPCLKPKEYAIDGGILRARWCDCLFRPSLPARLQSRRAWPSLFHSDRDGRSGQHIMTADQRTSRPIISALGAFLRAGVRPSTPLQRAIATMLVVKLVVIVAMRLFLFSGDLRVEVDDRVLETHLAASGARPSPQP
ncbi:hypothetical protein [Rhodomicrobium sp.]|uniref:hypothetical protein n=2 Tax=Rhodomicrobium TaxID=1068 RepID=UPI0039E46FA3